MFSGEEKHRTAYRGVASAKGAIFVWLLLAASMAMKPANAADGSVELYYDDGTAEIFNGFNWYTDVFAVKYSLPDGWSAANILEAQYYVRNINTIPCTATVHVYDGEPVAGNLVDLMNPVPVTISTPPWEAMWITVELDVTVYGDFYVALESTGSSLGVDQTPPHGQQSAGRWGGLWMLPTDPWPYWRYIGGDYMIRVTVESANQPPVADAGVDQTVEATSPDGAAVTLDGSWSEDPDGDALTYSWSWDSGSASGETATVTLPLGVTTVTLTVEDGNGGTASDTVEITVQDTTPPVMTASVSPDTLWPPNHEYVDVEASVTASDASDESVTLTLISVTSNEPDDDEGVGDGNTVDDTVIEDEFHFKLRAERDGAGTGRIYTITYSATDASGNTATTQVRVNVPRDNRK